MTFRIKLNMYLNQYVSTFYSISQEQENHVEAVEIIICVIYYYNYSLKSNTLSGKIFVSNFVGKNDILSPHNVIIYF